MLRSKEKLPLETNSRENCAVSSKKKISKPPPLKYGDYLFMGRRTFQQKEQYKPGVEEFKEQISTDFHTISMKELVDRLATDPEKGLKNSQAKVILDRDGPNELTPPRDSIQCIFMLRHLGYITIPLLIAAIVCFITYIIPNLRPMGSYSLDKVFSGLVLISAVIIVMGFSYFLETRSSRMMDSFRSMYHQYSILVRDGQLCKVNVRGVVVGDIVLLKSGDFVPADLRIVEAKNLEMEEFLLNNIPGPRPKTPLNILDDPLETENLAFFGTYCVGGCGKGIAVATGDQTAMAQMAKWMVSFQEMKTPLYIEVNRLVSFLAIGAVCLGFMLFTFSYQIGWSWLDTLLYLLVLVIANMPEILLSGVKASLAFSAKRMASKNCLVKNLEAVESLASVSVICCSTKEILTQNRFTFNHLWMDNRIVPQKASKGRSELKLTDVQDSGTWDAFTRAVCLCNTLEFQTLVGNTSSEKMRIIDPFEDAILKFLKDSHVDVTTVRGNYRKVFEVTLNSDNNCHITIHEKNQQTDEWEGPYILSVKGAPEIVIHFCSNFLCDGRQDPVNVNAVRQAAETLCSMGETVVAFCDTELPEKEFPQNFDFKTENLPLEDLRFLGMLSFLDPVRPSVIEAVRICRNAGIKVMLVTEDHPELAKAVARKVGIITETNETRNELAERLRISHEEVEPGSVPAVVICNAELEGIDEVQLRCLIASYKEIVFARVTPSQKVRIVQACQGMGESVAITGRSIEDCSVLKVANVGITMGKNACERCKETANLILLDNSFASIVPAIEEGRLIFDNLRKSIAYVLTCKIAEILPFVLLLTLEIPLPLGFTFVLLIFLGTDLLPAMSLLHEKPESDIMYRQPRSLKKNKLISLHFTNKVVMKSYLTIGVTVAMAGVYTYLVIMAENGFLPHSLLGIRKAWYSTAVNDLKDCFNQEWTYTARKSLEQSCQTGFFITVIVVQWFSLITCRKSRDPLSKQGSSNYALNFSLIFETILALLLCYIPGMNFLFRTYPLKFIWWLPGLPFGIYLLAYDEVRRFIIRHSPTTSWIATETY